MLLRSLRIYIFFLFAWLALTSFRASVHPYHVGSVEFNYNSSSRTFEVTSKLFLDDLENALKEKYGKQVRFHEAKSSAEMNQLLARYCEEYLKLRTDGKYLKLRYIGFEEDSESVNIYLESEACAAPKKVETAVSLLYNLFDDQMSIIHIVVDGKRQSDRLFYPNRYLYKAF